MALTVPTTTAITNYNYSQGDQFDTLIVNDTEFVIFNKPLCSDQSKSITLATNCHCVFLDSMEAEQDITINATNMLAFGSFSAKNGTIRIHAKNFYGCGISLKGVAHIQADEDVIISGKVDKTVVKGENIQVGLTEQMHEVAIEVKKLFSQEINDNGLQIAQTLLTAAQNLHDSSTRRANTLTHKRLDCCFYFAR